MKSVSPPAGKENNLTSAQFMSRLKNSSYYKHILNVAYNENKIYEILKYKKYNHKPLMSLLFSFSPAGGAVSAHFSPETPSAEGTVRVSAVPNRSRRCHTQTTHDNIELSGH